MVGPQWIVRKRRLKAWALAHGVPIPTGFRISPVCGAPCRELIRRVEAKAWGPAAATGKWDGRLTALIAPKRSVGQKMLKVARTQVGVKEHPPGSNRGPQVDKYERTTGAIGQPWCASFITWLHVQATGRGFKGLPNPAYVPSFVQTARAHQAGLYIVTSGNARAGDLVCFDWQPDGVADHIGILTTPVNGSGAFTSIEGNTAVGNDSNGGQVMVRQRNRSQVQAFIRIRI